jgi:hypothetical protein
MKDTLLREFNKGIRIVRNTKLISKDRDSPLVQISGDLDEVNHFLRLRDRQPVQDVLKYLQNAGAATYIGGSVVENYLFNGEREYNDVDILGIVGDRDTYNGINGRLASVSDSDFYEDIEKMVVRASEILKIKAIEIDKKPDVVIGNTNFSVKNTNSHEYVTVPLDARFILRPRPHGLRRLLGKPADIDVNITAGRNLRHQLQQAFDSDFFAVNDF